MWLSSGGVVLELLIIVSLALALFLVMKNFPQTGEAVVEKKGDRTVGKFWQNMFPKKRESALDEIKEEIAKGQENIVAPGDIDIVQRRYAAADPEVARFLFDADKALERDDLREAEDMALSAIKCDTRCSQAYVIIGKIAHLRGAFDDAGEAYRMAIKCNGDNGEAYFGLGQIELRKEDYTQAIEHLQKAVILYRGEAEWYGVLGKAYMQVRQFAKAAKALKRAASLDMDNKEYRELASEAEDKQRSHAQAFRNR